VETNELVGFDSIAFPNPKAVGENIDNTVDTLEGCDFTGGTSLSFLVIAFIRRTSAFFSLCSVRILISSRRSASCAALNVPPFMTTAPQALHLRRSSAQIS
jgi:hypothetical protein